MTDDLDLSGMTPRGVPLADIALGGKWRLLVHWIADDEVRTPYLRLWKAHRGDDGGWELAPGPSLFLKGERALGDLIGALEAARRFTARWVEDVKFTRPPRRRDWGSR